VDTASCTLCSMASLNFSVHGAIRFPIATLQIPSKSGQSGDSFKSK
jgi:hypothetical protein